MPFCHFFDSLPYTHSEGDPLNALISAPAEAIGPAIHDGKEGEQQHAEDLALMDALKFTPREGSIGNDV